MKNTAENVKNSKLIESGKLIADYRNRIGTTQEELAESVNKALGEKTINRKTISRIENGAFDPHLTTFFEITEALHVTPNDLSPKELLEGTTLERYHELDTKSRAQLKGMINILIEGQSSPAK